ncbi:hypothetical protein PPL_09190 [Heterostelium album PN500]|uniref:CHCH domain-containing protein n=1 Tax=Heterostelium pallidum (strain ATCC 26659 / Pp 5 / PN500) TaxID=670386 RepID=D3BKV8_HETP5|nr:hypothetical protein PPL_09190 [Heterostelium album PN500]EFA78538.1 hypothetical protein PPL_09190 [Heterostelium album PN500]|eukprot:XP_020430662.1 hypothetical protein PPL_09190 [Heterostelium album PN500]
MARRGASSSRSSPKAPTTTTASKPTPAPTNTHNSAPHQPAPVVVQGPGILSTMASSMAGAVAGNVIGHALVGGVSSMMGGNEPAATQIPEVNNNQNMQLANENNQCNTIYKSFMTCLEKNSNDLASCQWVYDSYIQCKSGNNGEKFY